MTRPVTTFVCRSCGATRRKWSGQCDACGEWNTIENSVAFESSRAGRATGFRAVDLKKLSDDNVEVSRTLTGVSELDRVFGGGIVRASAILLGGDPGIGKSTLLLQAAARLAERGTNTVYVSGEEAAAQIRMRAQRLGLTSAPVRVAVDTSLRDVLATLGQEQPEVVIIDSIQTMWLDGVDASPGSIGQVRASTHELVHFAKSTGTTVILVGHVTKDGQIAGPRAIEHMVDTVLYFEGDRGHHFRILRAVKNRFGPADEIGVFEMTGKGLEEVDNPSALFLSNRETVTPGSAVFAGIEGSRPLLVEIQALVANSPLGSPRRTVVGWDSGRLAMILAVLDARAGMSFAGKDVYLNVAGGLRITDPAADLAVAGALVSANEGIAISGSTALFGEVSLSGALRPVAQIDPRLREARKLGFDTVLAPSQKKTRTDSGLVIREMLELGEFVNEILAARPSTSRPPDVRSGD